MAESIRGFKNAIYEQFARIGNAVGSPRRLELLDLLCQGPRTVEALSRQAGQSLANTSHHLQVMRRARLVDAEKQGLFVTYRLASDEVCTFFQTLKGLAESHLVDIEHITRSFLEERDALEPVQRDLLLERVRGGEVTVLDVRPREEFEAGHIPGAISVPMEELERRLAELPQERQIVAYCRGPYCVFAMEAVKILRERGFTAVRMEDGVPEWRAHGFEIETGEATL